MKTSPKNNKSNAIIAILIGIIIFLFFICLFLFLSQNKTPELSPDIAPKDTDKYSEPMNDDSTDKLDDQGGGAAFRTDEIGRFRQALSRRAQRYAVAQRGDADRLAEKEHRQ